MENTRLSLPAQCCVVQVFTRASTTRQGPVAISADGRQFASVKTGNNAFFVDFCSTDDLHAGQRVACPASPSSFAWQADSRHLVVYCPKDGPEDCPCVYTIDTKGSAETADRKVINLTGSAAAPAQKCYAEQWSRDGRSLRLAKDGTNTVIRLNKWAEVAYHSNVQDVLMSCEGQTELGKVLAWSNNLEVSRAEALLTLIKKTCSH